MTVEELIEALNTYPPTMRVWAEGCDCTNPVSAVSRWVPRDGIEAVYIEVSLDW